MYWLESLHSPFCVDTVHFSEETGIRSALKQIQYHHHRSKRNAPTCYTWLRPLFKTFQHFTTHSSFTTPSSSSSSFPSISKSSILYLRSSLHPLALHGALNKACYPLLQSSLHHHNSSTPLAQQQPRQTPVASQITLIRLSPEHHPHSNSFTLLSPDHRHQSADNKSGTFSLVSPGQHS